MSDDSDRPLVFPDMGEPLMSGDPRDISRQTIRLSRSLDRLAEGKYIVMLEKRSRLEVWEVTILSQDGQIVRKMNLTR